MKHLGGVVKLVIVTGLMVFVLANVQWHDTVIVTDAEGVEHTTTGEILGRWDGSEVRFQPVAGDGTRGAERVITDDQRAGGSVIVSPGIGTYVVNLRAPLLALGMLCYFVTVVVAGTRWWWLLRVNRLAVTWLDALRFTWIGLFFNNIVPGQTGGDVVKAVYIVKHCAGGRMPALISVLVDRVLGLGSLALLGAFAVLAVLDRDQFDGVAAGIWSVLAVVGLLGVVAFSKRVRRSVRLDGLLNKLPHRVAALLKHVDQAVFFYRSHKLGIFAWVVVGMFNHSLSVLCIMLIGASIGVPMPALEYFVLVPVINILSAFPIAPNGWGVGEALFKFSFGKFGATYLAGVPQVSATVIMGTMGVALSVIFRIQATLWSLLGGLLVLTSKQTVTRADIAHEVELENYEAGGAPSR